MPRELGSHPRRIALIAVVAIVCASVAAYLLWKPRPESLAPASMQAPAAPAVTTTDASDVTAPPTSGAPTSSGQVALSRAPVATLPSTMPHGAAGMIVGIDPETGRIGPPSKTDRAALSSGALASPAIDRSEAGLTVVHKPDGSKMIDLQGRFQEYMVVHIAPDGKKSEACVQGPEVEAALKSAAAAANAAAPASQDTDASTPAPTER